MSQDNDSIATPPKGFVTVCPLRRHTLPSGKTVWMGLWQSKRIYLFLPNVRSGDDHEWDICMRREDWDGKAVP